MPNVLITMRAPGEATTTRPGQSEAAWKTWQVCLIPQLVFMLLHSFKHDKHLLGPQLVQTEAVWTIPWVHFSYSCCVGGKHHANHGSVGRK